MLGKDEALPMLILAGQPGFSGATYSPRRNKGFIRLFFRDDLGDFEHSGWYCWWFSWICIRCLEKVNILSQMVGRALMADEIIPKYSAWN